MHSFTYILLAVASVVNAANFTVKVGMNSTGGIATAYNPNQITAAAGDIITFEFLAKNHTVTQSSFAEPCTKQFNTATNEAGVDSGFMPVATNATEIPTWTIQVIDASAPQWFFCNQATHCNSGMVFAINAPATGAKTFEAYVSKAANATHPDPALNQTAPFTPTPASSVSVPAGSATATGTDSVLVPGATDAPANAAPGVSSSGGLSLSAGAAGTGTSAADQAAATGAALGGANVDGRLAVFVGLVGMVMGTFVL